MRLRDLFKAPAPAPAGNHAMEKRRLERLLREEGIPKSAAVRIVAAYFNGNPPAIGGIERPKKRGH